MKMAWANPTLEEVYLQLEGQSDPLEALAPDIRECFLETVTEAKRAFDAYTPRSSML